MAAVAATPRPIDWAALAPCFLPPPLPLPRLAFHRGPHSHSSEERFPHMIGPPFFFRERTSASRRAAFTIPLIAAHTMVLPSLSLSLPSPTPPADPNPAK